MSYTLRPARPEDQPLLMELMWEIYLPFYAYLWHDDGSTYLDWQYGPEAFAAHLAKPGCRYEFVCLGDRPLGIRYLRTDKPIPEYPDLPGTKLQKLYLHPEVTGRGWGRRLIEEVFDFARARGDTLVWLETMEKTPTAGHAPGQAYERLGFEWVAGFKLDHPLSREAWRGMGRMVRWV